MVVNKNCKNNGCNDGPDMLLYATTIEENNMSFFGWLVLMGCIGIGLTCATPAFGLSWVAGGFILSVLVS